MDDDDDVSMENPKGEVEIALGGEPLRLRPSHEAIEAIERRCDRGMLALARDWSADELKNWQMAAVLFECAKAAGSKLSAGEVGRRLRLDGAMRHHQVVGAILLASLNGGDPNVPAAPETREASPAATATASPGAAT